MKENALEDRCKILFDRLGTIMGYHSDVAKRKKLSKKGSTYSSKVMELPIWVLNFMDRCNKNLLQGKYHLALIDFYNEYHEYFEPYATHVDFKWLETGDFKLHMDRLTLFSDIIRLYLEWKEDVYLPSLHVFQGTNLFKDHELEKEHAIDPIVFSNIEIAVTKELFKFYKYREGKGKLWPHTRYKIYPTIGISHSLEEWFSFLEKQTTESVGPDEAIVTLFLKLDYVNPFYNNFVISIHQQDSIWITSDQIDFHNPRNKKSRRKPERVKENHLTYIDLPYELGFPEELEKLRADSKALISDKYFEVIDLTSRCQEAMNKRKGSSYDYWLPDFALDVIKGEFKQRKMSFNAQQVTLTERHFGKTRIQQEVFKKDGSIVAVANYGSEEVTLTIYKRPEILFFQVQNLHPAMKMYLVSLISRLFEEIHYNPPQEKVLLGHQYLQQKLLSDSATFQPAEQNTFEGWDSEDTRKRVTEIIESINAENNSLVPLAYSHALTSPEYERNWLGTPAALENLVRWTVLEDQAAEVSEKLKTLAERKDVDQSALHDLFIQRIDHVLENALKDVTVERMYSEHFGDDKSTVKKENVHLTRFLDGQFKGKWSSYTKYNKIFYYWEKINRGYGTKCYWKDEVGHGAMKSPALVIDIENYWELLLILGLNDRKALPPYYQNYRSRNFVAYTGNSILDNTHPYALIEDPCSEENSNGIRFYVYMCKKCVAGIKAEYAKKQNTATSKS